MYSSRIRAALIVANILAAGALAGCGGGGTAGVADIVAPGVSFGGTVTAPGGSIAFNPPTGLRSMFARLFMSQAHAAVSGTFPVGAGVTINLIEINSSGAQVGAVLATATTNVSGAYTLVAPAGFTPAAKYVVRAVGTGGNQLDAMVTGTTVDVDPGSNVTKTLVLAAVAGGSLANLTPAAVLEVQSTVESLAKDAGTFTTVAEANAALTAAMQASEEASNIVSSTVSSGAITGTVTDSSNARLPNIKIVVRDFNNWVTRAVARTDANGVYTVNVPAGNYILGAINMTATSTAASEWWTAGGGVTNQFSADQITVGGTALTRDFVLDPGARISGTVTAESGGAALEGIKILIRDFTSDQPTSATRTGPDGKFRINVRPGTYTVGAYNSTRQAYATELYNPTLNGGVNATEATPITVAAASSTTADFSLLAGNKIAGLVSDPTSGIVAGMAVRFYTSTGAFIQGDRTDNQGQYQLWLRPATGYEVRSRGQTVTADLSAGSLTGQNFAAAVGRITATLSGPTGVISQAKVRVYNTSASDQGFETSNGDGTVTLYSTVTPVRVEIKIDNGAAIGSALYNSTGVVTRFGLAENITVNVGGAATALGSVTLAAGGVLSGTVTVAGVGTSDRVVQVRSGGVAFSANQFVASRTQSDGTYSVSLPAGTYKVRTCIPNACTGTAGFTDVIIAAGSNTTKDFAL